MIDYWINLTAWKKIKSILVLIGLIFLIFFCVINSQKIDVDFVFTRVQVSLILLIFISLVIGYALSSVIDYRKFIIKNNEIKKLKYKLDELEKSSAAQSSTTHSNPDVSPV